MQIEEYRRVNKEQKERIEILNKELNKVMAEATDIENKYYELQDKYKRLNIIINELEKWLVEWREMLDCPDFYEEGIIDCINETLTKLQKLKGVDKE